MSHEFAKDSDSAELTRIAFALDSDWHGHAVEWMWAVPLGEGRYRLMNSPFFAKGIRWLDIVEATKSDEGLAFSALVVAGGHSTYRVLLTCDRGSLEFERHWGPLLALGCSYEGSTDHLLAVDVPPSADIHLAYALLQARQRDGVWDFEEGHVGSTRVPPN